MKKNFTTSIFVVAIAAMAFSPFEAKANENRYAPEACIRNDGYIDSKCDKVDPNGPCDKEKECRVIRVE